MWTGDVEEEERQPSTGERAVRGAAVLIGSLALAFGGGLLFRMAGGWDALPYLKSSMADDLPWPPFPTGSPGYLTFVVPFALLAAVATQSGATGVFVLVHLFTAVWLSTAPYASAGRATSNYFSPVGVLDWLVGRDCINSEFFFRWSRAFSALSVMGLFQTVPLGWLLWRMGYPPDFAWSGVAMGLIYDLAWRLPSVADGKGNFDRGVPLAQFLWGAYLVLALLAVTLGSNCRSFAARMGRVRSAVAPTSDIWLRRVHKAANALGAVAFETVLVITAILYSDVTQADMKPQRENLVGVICTATLFPLVELGFRLYQANVLNCRRVIDRTHSFCCCIASSSRRRRNAHKLDVNSLIDDMYRRHSDEENWSAPEITYLLNEDVDFAGLHPDRVVRKYRLPMAAFLWGLRAVSIGLMLFVPVFTAYTAYTHRIAHKIPCGEPLTP